MRVSVLGAGGWGTTLAMVLNENGHSVTLWEFFPEYAKLLDKKRENIKFLKGVKIPKSIAVTSDLKKAVDASQVLVIAVPSHIVRSLAQSMKKLDYKNKILVSCTKGIEQKTLMTMTQVLRDVLGKIKKAVLSGPSHAEEVARKVPTTVTVASKDIKIAEMIQKLFATKYFRVYSQPDVVGVELGGSLKNTIAIAAGILDGLGLGDNTKAALITRGLAEMKRLGVAMGAHEMTFFGLAGLGDLVVTCESRHSRNRFVGEQLGKGKKIKQILGSMEMVAEGVKTTMSGYELAKKHRVDMPILNEIYNVIYKEKAPAQSVRDLMTRSLKSEREFLGKR